MGLIKAISTYRIGKGTSLSTYTARCIEDEILMLIRSNKKHRTTLSLSDPIGVDKDGNELTFLDLLFEKEDSIYESVERSMQRERLLRELKQVLSEREFQVICLRFALKGGVPMPQREVAKMLKISRSYISRIEKRAIEKLRKHLRKEDFYD
jgi:RNA polymerase sporulation-specific sigma factor